MRYFKLMFLVVFVVALFYSCLSQSKEKNNEGPNESITEMTASTSKEAQNNKEPKTKTLKYFDEVDQASGTVIERYPFPADWQEHNSGEFKYTGPNNVRVYAENGATYAYSNDPTFMQQYQAVGYPVKFPLTADQTIEEILVSIGNTINRKMTKKYPLKQIEDYDRMYDSMLFKINATPTHIEAWAIEWEDPDHTKWLTVFHYQITQPNNNVFWSYQASAIGAPAAYFEEAKRDYLNGLINRQVNTDWIMKMNQQNEYAIRKSEELNQRRIAEFKATSAERRRGWEKIQEERSLATEKYNDFLTDRVNIIDPNTTSKYKIDNTSNHYWINTEGEYIGTEKYYDDPNKNDYLNNTTWRPLQIDDYKLH